MTSLNFALQLKYADCNSIIPLSKRQMSLLTVETQYCTLSHNE